MVNNHQDRSYPGGRKTKKRPGLLPAPTVGVVAFAAMLAIAGPTESHAQTGGTGDGVFEALGRTTSVDCVNINTEVNSATGLINFGADYLLVNACDAQASFCREIFAICLSSLENSPQIDLRSPDRRNEDLLAEDTELNGVYTGSDTVTDSSGDIVQIVKTTFEDSDGATGKQILPGNRAAVDRDPGQTVTVRIRPKNEIPPLNNDGTGCPPNNAKVLVTDDPDVTDAITAETANIFGSVPSLKLRSARIYDLDQATKEGFVVLAVFDGFVVECVDPEDPEELVQVDVDEVLRLEAEIGVNTPGKNSGGDTWSGWPQF